MKFENKINALLSIIRDHEEKYSRACKDVKDLLDERQRVIKLYDETVESADS